MENSIRISLEVDPQKYLDLRERFIIKSEKIIAGCAEIDEDNLAEYCDSQFILHFDDNGTFQFASEERITDFFHIDTCFINGTSALDLATAAEMIISEQMNLYTYIVESAINKSLNNLLN